MIEELIEILDKAPSIDTQNVLAFINEMVSANTTAFYNDDRKNRYLELNIPSLIELYNNSGNFGQINFSMIINKIKNSNNVVLYEQNLEYF